MRILDTKAAINKAKILSNINTNILSAELQRVCPRKEILIYFVGMLCFMGWNEGFSKCPVCSESFIHLILRRHIRAATSKLPYTQ